MAIIRKEDNFYPVLCGSTLFFIILEYKKKRSGNQDKCFKDFLGIIDPASIRGIDADSLHKYSSDCKNGKPLPAKGDVVRFGKKTVCNVFRDDIKKSYNEIIERVVSFANTYLDKKTHALIIKALMELIEKDKNFDNHNRSLCVNPGFLPAYKEDFLKSDATIYFYNFLLGVWFYCYQYAEDDELKAKTIERWTDKTKKYTENESVFNLGLSGKYDAINLSYNYTENITVLSEQESSEENEDDEVGDDSIILTLGNGIMPDITKYDPMTQSFIITKERVKETGDRCKRYVRASSERYSSKKTFLYDVERPFKDFYVCNSVARRLISPITFTNRNHYYSKREVPKINDITIDKLEKHNNVIIGNGGLGKSMMLNKLFLDVASDYLKGGTRIPIIITLRSYRPDEKSLEFLLTSELKRFDPSLRIEDLYTLFAAGRVVCLLDGLDEIKKEYVCDFQDELDRIKDAYQDCYFVIASRDIPEVRTLNNFAEYEIQLFSKEQAYEMIRKLDSQSVDQELKDNFIRDLENDRFKFKRDEKQSFLGNPLFLTIMLITYSRTNDIPKKRYLFYEKAYLAMASEYDAKTKRINRPFFTGLDEKSFQKYFAYFCANTYADSAFEFSHDEMIEYFDFVIRENDLDISPEMFIKDATEKLCLMYKDGDIYCFIHRSFQEYFAAYCFINMLDSDFDIVYHTLMDLDEQIIDDEILSMLYSMDKERVEKLIFIPYLKEMFMYMDNPKKQFKEYMKEYHDTIQYATGILDEDMCNNDPHSAMFLFIRDTYRLDGGYVSPDFDYDEDYADSSVHYVYVEDIWLNQSAKAGNMQLMEVDTVPSYIIETYMDDDYIEKEGGFLCDVEVGYLLEHPERNEIAYDIIQSKEFCFRKEFEAFKELLITLQDKYAEQKNQGYRKFGLRN